jgi:hypothetical protein
MAEPKRRRSRPLTSIEAVRKEMATLYYAVKHDVMPLDKGKALTYVLSQVAATFKMRDEELEALIEKLQKKGAK